MSDEPRTVWLVLDTSAISAFARGSVAVGEVIAEIDDDNGVVVLPLPCLIEAAALVPDSREWLDFLIAHRATQIAVDDPADWQMVAGLQAILGTYQHATAAWIALDWDVSIMTRNPEAYASLKRRGLTLPFED